MHWHGLAIILVMSQKFKTNRKVHLHGFVITGNVAEVLIKRNRKIHWHVLAITGNDTEVLNKKKRTWAWVRYHW